MELTEMIGIKQKIEVRRLNEIQYYISSVQEMRDGLLYIDVPYHSRRPLSLPPGTRVNIRFMINDGYCRFDTQVIDFKNEEIPYFIVALPKEYEFVQRRDLFRIDYVCDAECRFFRHPKDQELKDAVPCKVIKGKTLNISGSGVLLVTDEPVNAEHFKMILKLDEDNFFQLSSQVIWKTKVLRNNGLFYYSGIRWVNLSAKEQRFLIKFLNKIQVRRHLFEKKDTEN